MFCTVAYYYTHHILARCIVLHIGLEVCTGVLLHHSNKLYYTEKRRYIIVSNEKLSALQMNVKLNDSSEIMNKTQKALLEHIDCCGVTMINIYIITMYSTSNNIILTVINCFVLHYVTYCISNSMCYFSN